MAVTEIETLPQNMRALQGANKIRVARAKLVRDVKAGRIQAADVVLDPPVCVRTMTIYTLLDSQHNWGHTRTKRLLAKIPLGESRQLKDLTYRQAIQLAIHLRK